MAHLVPRIVWVALVPQAEALRAVGLRAPPPPVRYGIYPWVATATQGSTDSIERGSAGSFETKGVGLPRWLGLRSHMSCGWTCGRAAPPLRRKPTFLN